MVQKTQANIKGTAMYAASIATIAASGTDTTAGTAIDVENVDWATIVLEFTGKNAANGVVTYYLSYSADGTNFSTETDTFSATLTSTTKVISKPNLIDVRGIRKVKMVKIVNGDAAVAVDLLNAYLSSKQ